MKSITVRAHAKINLNLKLLGQGPDDYRLLETAVQSISLWDTLQIETAAEGIALCVDDPRVPADASNLIWRAAARLPPPRAAPPGLRLRLCKRIPAGAGLGGGSSDAAATLLGLSRLWGLGLSAEELAPIAAELGVDVPYFLVGGTALLTGRGTEVHPLPDLLGYRLLVVFPGTPLSTREVYAQVRAPLTGPGETGSMSASGRIPTGAVEGWVQLGNDLEPYAERLCPAIGDIKDRLRRSGATAVAMTGSGSAAFGVFRDGRPLERAAQAMRASGWLAWCCEPIGGAEYRRGVFLG